MHDVEGIACCWCAAYRDQGPDLTELTPAFLAERTLETFRRRAHERVANTLVAWNESSHLLGFCTCTADEVEQFFLSAGARGTGVAEKLLEHAEATLRSHGTSVAHLYCFPKNRRGLRFYERCRWQRQGGPCAHAVQVSGGRTHTLHLVRLEKALRPPPTSPCSRVVTGSSELNLTEG